MNQIQGIGVSGILINDGKALIIRRDKKDSEPGFWEFPKGAVDFNEHPYKAIIREYLEETGLRVKIKEPLTVISWGYKRENAEYHVAENIFLMKLDAGEKFENVKLSPDHDQFRWVSAIEAKTIEPIVPDRRDLLIRTLESE